MTTGPIGGRPKSLAGVVPARLGRYVSLAMWQALFLFAVDGVANVLDYLFHAFLGRSLAPSDFAVVLLPSPGCAIAASVIRFVRRP